jgi:hypothetical protein
MDSSYSRGEIISELQHLPYHSHRAYALRVLLSLLEDLGSSRSDRPNSDTNQK